MTTITYMRGTRFHITTVESAVAHATTRRLSDEGCTITKVGH